MSRPRNPGPGKDPETLDTLYITINRTKLEGNRKKNKDEPIIDVNKIDFDTWQVFTTQVHEINHPLFSIKSADEPLPNGATVWVEIKEETLLKKARLYEKAEELLEVLTELLRASKACDGFHAIDDLDRAEERATKLIKELEDDSY